MKYFGHLSHSCIKSRRSNVHKPIFFDILTENIYVSVYDRKKNRSNRLCCFARGGAGKRRFRRYIGVLLRNV